MLRIRLIYYPPYHSKYNPIERGWATLEKFWNGAILDSIEAAIEWASRMAWNGMQPIVYLVEGIYEKGVNVLPEVLEACQSFWKRSDILPKCHHHPALTRTTFSRESLTSQKLLFSSITLRLYRPYGYR